MKDKKKNDRISSIITVIIVMAVAVLGAVDNVNRFVPLLVIGLVAVFAIAALTAVKKKNIGGKTVKRMNGHEMNTLAFSAQEGKADALRCTCAHGKQRYLDQAAMFYKNGLIDRAEYNAMCERYNKLDLPEGL